MPRRSLRATIRVRRHDARVPRFAALILVGLLAWATTSATGQESGGARRSGPILEDTFGRVLNDRGITLVDWEGHIANPAVRLTVRFAKEDRWHVTLKSDEPRLYFDLPSETGAEGPLKNLSLTTTAPEATFYLAIFPDRDTRNETHTLEIRYSNGGSWTGETIDIHVIDQDVDRAHDFDIIVDYSQDKTGLFDDPSAVRAVQQAADDWAYFLAGMDLDRTPARQEPTWIWSPGGFTGGGVVQNQYAYTGFLLYAYGIQHDELRAGGEPSHQGGLQSTDGITLFLKRSGGIELEKRGNFNTLGWMTSDQDDLWWQATNLGDVPNDLYSIAHHEMGHALMFHPGYNNFKLMKARGQAENRAIGAYFGSFPVVDQYDHLPGAIDPASRRGAYGNEYHGAMLHGRWIVTRLDLLVAQAVGYELRDTSPFAPLAGLDDEKLEAGVNVSFTSERQAEGGVPSYYWAIKDGALPDGLSLDSFTGTISGTPKKTGEYEFTVGLRDNSEWNPGVTGTFNLTVKK